MCCFDVAAFVVLLFVVCGRAMMDYESEPESFQRQALEIRQPGVDFDPRATPENGEQFLMHMLYERKGLPAIVVRRPKIPIIVCASQSPPTSDTDMSPPSPTLLPTAELKTVQVETFLATREYVTEMRAQLEAHAYNNALELPLTTDGSAWYCYCQRQSPLLSTILRINQRSLEQLLDWLSDWLNGVPTFADDDDKEEQLDSEVDSASTTQPCTTSSMATALADSVATTLDLTSNDQWLGMWLYAVLACLHLPLEPAVHSTLREIARACIRQRSRLQPEELSKAVPYNLIISLIVKVFAQLDFAEFV